MLEDFLGNIAGRAIEGEIRAFTRLQWALITIASILCGIACVGAGNLLGIPREVHFNGSLLTGGAPVAGIIVAIISIIASLLIGSLIASTIELEAPLFCCCLGLAAFAVRCGPIRPVLQYANGTGVFLMLLVETLILGVILIGGWTALRGLLDKVVWKKDASTNHAAPNEMTDASLQQKLSTLAVQMVAMAILELIFIQTDVKPQAMAGVFLAAYLGSMAAYMFTPLAQGIWIWAGPVGVGLIGYLLAFFSGETPLTGELHGFTAALARPTPLDYASMGIAGALLGYWSMRRWAQPDAEEDEETIVQAPS